MVIQHTQFEANKNSKHLSMDGLATVAGQDFFVELCRWIRKHLGADYAFVGRFDVREIDRITVLAMDCDDPEAEIPCYELTGTPCERAVTHGEEIHLEQSACSDFPDDEMFHAEGIIGYWGVPLFDYNKNPIGLIAVCSRAALVVSDEQKSLVRKLAVRASLEMAQQEIVDALGSISTNFVSEGFQENLERLALQLAATMRANHAFVAECVEENRKQFRYVACAYNGEPYRDILGQTADYEGTPCGRLRAQQSLTILEGAQRLFPDCEELVEDNIQAYVGLVLKGSSGETLGHMVVMSDRPMRRASIDQQIFQVIAGQAAGELERAREARRRERLNQALFMRRKMESLGLMAGAIAHDFNNLLVGILGYAEMAKEYVPLESPAHDCLSKVESNSLKARSCVDQLLDFAGRKVEPNHELVDLTQLAPEAVKAIPTSLYPEVAVKHTSLDAPGIVRGDKTQIHQTIVNLVLNAAEAMVGNGGEVIVDVRQQFGDRADEKEGLQFDFGLPNDDLVVLEVKDEGAGISPEHLNRIFDPFYTTKQSGRGLGLSTIVGVVKSHNGGLAVTSNPEVGTCFRILFPAERVSAVDGSVPKAPAKTMAHQMGRQLLVVDDEKELRDYIDQRLSSWGYSVTTAADCGTAVSALQAGPEYAAALIDITMPGSDGWETLEKLRQISPAMPVIMMSGHSEQSISGKLSGLPDVTFLKKPFTSAEIRAKLQLALGES